jgi:hypothetical protein
MKLRDLLINLAITAGVVLVIVLFAVVLKSRRPELPKSGGARMGGELELAAKPVSAVFQVVPGAVLVETRANEADTLRMKVGDEEHVFVLYFVDALEASDTHPQRIHDQAKWFGLTEAGPNVIVEVGQEALQYVRRLLTSCRFYVITRWERVPNTMRYYALISVEHQPGKPPVWLADLLIGEGFGRVHGLTTPFPPASDGRTIPQYLQDLKRLSQNARQRKVGVWSRVP